MIYLKSLALGLLAGVAAIVVQAAAFYRYEPCTGGFGTDIAGGGTRVYGTPVIIAFVVGSFGAWWRLRGRKNCVRKPISCA